MGDSMSRPQLGRLEGRVIRWDRQKAYGFIRRTEYDSVYWVTSRQVRPDSLGRNHLQLDEPVTFKPGPNEGNKYPHALEVETFRAPEDINPDYRERCQLKSWNGYTGWLARPDGSELYFHFDSLVAGTRRDLKVGSWIRCQPAPPLNGGHQWRAVSSEVCTASGEVSEGSCVD